MPRIYTHKPIEYAINNNGCHICTSHKLDKDGYPFMRVKGKLCLVARYVWEQATGQNIGAALIHRSCKNRACINFKHLVIISHKPKKTPAHPLSVEERFWMQINKVDDETSCWEWTASKSSGYGRIKLGKGLVLVHRYSYTLHYGPIPVGLLVCHKCNNRACVRPDHLYAGTHKDNYADMARAGNAFDIASAGIHTRRTSQIRGSKVPASVINEQLALEIYDKIKRGHTHRALADEYGIGKTTITDIGSGRSWGWLTRASTLNEAG